MYYTSKNSLTTLRVMTTIRGELEIYVNEPMGQHTTSLNRGRRNETILLTRITGLRVSTKT